MGPPTLGDSVVTTWLLQQLFIHLPSLATLNLTLTSAQCFHSFYMTNQAE